MIRSLILLITFLSTFAWPYAELSSDNRPDGACLYAEMHECNEEHSPDQDKESSVNTTLLEDFIHETTLLTWAPPATKIVFYYSRYEPEGTSLTCTQPPRS